MTVKVNILPLTYRDQPWAAKVERVCLSWAGTPYKLNKCTKGRYVDCLHFAAAVLDELYGTEHSRNLKSLPGDACIHNRKGIAVALRALLRSYPIKRVRDGSVEAGDLVVFGHASERSGPSHLLVASRRSVLWEGTRPRVRASGYGILDTEKLVAIYRATDKHLW